MDEQDKELIHSEIGRRVIQSSLFEEHVAKTEAINQNPTVGEKNDRMEKNPKI
ncbi:hypothetical protein [Ammoniphilus sp. CFH 90114]|uniref:hypothetical protein n=1 Tax=Ammoniphilus sp. CFH 90114 TaxID=2493665 RepID=UPI0013E917B2|nr:hypothetical protein [Ammoniphilus sp. CFH 90114]